MTWRTWRKASASVVFVVLAGCSEPAAEPSISDVLSAVEGTPLTPAEVSSLLQTADLLCGLDDDVLNELLVGVGPDRLPFTDWVFSERCSDREGLYKAALPQRLAEHVEQSDG